MSRPAVEYDFKHNGERLLHLIRQRYPDYHPIMAIAQIAHDAAEGEEPDLPTALRAHTTVLAYVEPSLKSVEVNVVEDRNRTINVSLFEEVPSIPDSEALAAKLAEDRKLAIGMGAIIDVEEEEMVHAD